MIKTANKNKIKQLVDALIGEVDDLYAEIGRLFSEREELIEEFLADLHDIRLNTNEPHVIKHIDSVIKYWRDISTT